MAQLRRDYQRFVRREAEVIVIGPEDAAAFKEYWEAQELPFTGLPDPHGTVLKRYGQEVSLFKFGRMPAQMLIDKAGRLRFVHYGKAMSDIPINRKLLRLLDDLNAG